MGKAEAEKAKTCCALPHLSYGNLEKVHRLFHQHNATEVKPQSAIEGSHEKTPGYSTGNRTTEGLASHDARSETVNGRAQWRVENVRSAMRWSIVQAVKKSLLHGSVLSLCSVLSLWEPVSSAPIAIQYSA